MESAALLCAFGLTLVHLFAHRLRFIRTMPRSRWLSGASGVSVAYVFVHLLPDLAEHQEALSELPFLAFLENHVYVMALAGLAVFYGLERLIKADDADEHRSSGVFWLHVLSFSLYNFLIGYLLVHREEPGLRTLLFFFVAMALHFLVNDFGLRQDHKGLYSHYARWLLSAAVLLGWGVGASTEIADAALGLLFSFLAGGVVLNVLKEELPEERKSRFWAFALGTALYTALLLV